jgi:hypothetical protein
MRKESEHKQDNMLQVTMGSRCRLFFSDLNWYLTYLSIG